MINSTDFKKLKPNQGLYLVRYSQKEHQDYLNVKFLNYENTHPKGSFIDYKYKLKNSNQHKKAPLLKARYRLFIDKNEMMRVLYNCFVQRNIELSENYKALIINSQNNRPEIWI